jgi:NADH-quinone oxidoreductase subunit M
VLFFVFFEVVLLPMYAVIAVWGAEDRRRAARKFVLYTLLGSVLLLVGVFTVVAAAGTADIVALTGGGGLSRTTQLVAFTLFAFAFAVKSPLWPLHTWLPDAHTQAPTVGSVILAGVLLKMGTYGLIRVGVGVAPEGARWAAPVLGTLAVAAIIVGSLVCLAQDELKRLIAYSSVGHMGFVLLGIATLTATGLQAALIGNVAHGVITGLLFFLAGAIKDRFHTGSLAELRGLRERMPVLSGLLGFAAIASLGLPGLAGFWGEAFAVVGALERDGPLWTALGVVAAAGGALTAAYFLRLLRRVTHGPASPAVAGTPCAPVAPIEVVSWAPLVLLALVIGLVPALVVGLAGAPVNALVEAIG